MAEPDIAIDIISPSPALSPVHGSPRRGGPGTSARRPSLAIRILGLAALDALVTAVSAAVSYAIFNPAGELLTAAVSLPLMLLTVSASVSFLERGLYTPPEVAVTQLNGRKLALAWVQAVAIGTLVTFCIAAIAGTAQLHPAVDGMTRTLRGAWLPLFLVGGYTALIAARSARLRVLPNPVPLNRTVVIGDTRSIHDLIQRLRGATTRVFDIVGVVEQTQGHHSRGSFMGLPVVGSVASVERMIRQDAVDTVVVALPWSAGESVRDIIRQIAMAPVDIYVYPGMPSLDLKPHRDPRNAELPMMLVCNRPISGWRALVKRAEDIVLSAGVLAFIAPVLLIIAAAIKLNSRGPVFFRQRRLGYNNRVIEVLKFRSMYTHLADADAKMQVLRGDRRVTRVGAFLRRTSLDELPQLLNVLKGDMSLVGPRPHALATTAGGLALEEAVPTYASRHRVKPGITGWAQINGHRGALDSVDKIVNRVDHDLYYIENWSLGLDFRILLQTVRLVFADDNAF